MNTDLSQIEKGRKLKDLAVLAYSGGLDTSVSVKWLQKEYNLNVITVTVDVGQRVDFKEIKDKAENLGVVKHYSIDGKDEFAEDYIIPAIKANALYVGKYSLNSALSRPLIASKLVEIAKKEGAKYVAHGCTGKGNDQVRFDVTIKSLAPEINIVAPVREWNLSRDEEIKFAESNGIPIPISLDNPYSIDENLWGRSVECGVLDIPEQEPPDDVYEWTKSPEKAPEKPQSLTVSFEGGTPTAIDGSHLKPAELIMKLNKIAGDHGIGRIDHIEDRLVGIKSREVYECPAATVLLDAHFDLEKMVLTRHEVQFKHVVDTKWANLVYMGLWMDPLKSDLDAFINETQTLVSGHVKMKFYKGNSHIISRSSPTSLYNHNLASYNKETSFNQAWSSGFIEIWGLPTKTAHIIKKKVKEN